MMRRLPPAILMPALCALLGCDTGTGLLPIETGFAFTNLSRDEYATLGIRVHDPAGDSADFFFTATLAPGATTRIRFLDALGQDCPDALDFRVFTYQRINRDLPIGLDQGEAIEPAPLAAGEIHNVPACAVQALETYTIVNWDAPDGLARVKFAQDTPVDLAIRQAGIFPNTDAVWEISGVDPALAQTPPPPHAEPGTIAGRVVSAAGAPWENVAVVLRTRFRVRLNDSDPTNDPDADFGDPIAFVFTDVAGAFSFERPAGAYRVEVFADGLGFQPASVDVEVPQTSLTFIAEPLP